MEYFEEALEKNPKETLENFLKKLQDGFPEKFQKKCFNDCFQHEEIHKGILENIPRGISKKCGELLDEP